MRIENKTYPIYVIDADTIGGIQMLAQPGITQSQENNRSPP